MKFCKAFNKKDIENTQPKKAIKNGMIHSFETFGAVDGPGVRLVIFFEGCPLRCVYCHNRDMLDMEDYMTMTPRALLEMVKDYKPYFGKKGGVTISGGDPVFQPKFLMSFLKLCKKEKVNVALDTSLFTTKEVIDDVFPYTDLFMVSLKHFDRDKHKCLTGVPNDIILENIRYLSKKIKKVKRGNKPKLWFRYMILPGYTDTKKNLKALVDFCHEIKNFELIDLLPYHRHGVYKWKQMGLKYALGGVKAPKRKSVLKIKDMLEKEGFKVLLND